MDTDAASRTHLKHLWRATMPITEPLAVGGRTFLQGHGILAEAAVAARLRFAHLWGDADDHQGAAVVFPLQDGNEKLVAAEGYYLTPPRDVAQTHSAGTKGLGVFEALPEAIDAETVTVTDVHEVLLVLSLQAIPRFVFDNRARRTKALLLQGVSQG